MARPAIDADSAALHMRKCDRNRVSRAKVGAPLEMPGGKPKMPGDLNDEQRHLWKAIVKQLRARRTVTKGDAQVIELYVRTHSQWVAACKYVDAHGPIVKVTKYSQGGNEYTIDEPNPALKLAATLASQLESLLREMGLTGVTREKVKPVRGAEKEVAQPGTVGWFQELANNLARAPELPDVDIKEEPDETTGPGVSGISNGDSPAVRAPA